MFLPDPDGNLTEDINEDIQKPSTGNRDIHAAFHL